MRIGYYLGSCPSGGIATHVLALIDHVRRDHAVTVFCHSRLAGQPFYRELNARNLPLRIVRPPDVTIDGGLRPLGLALFSMLATRALAAEALDVVHFHAGWVGILYAPILASRMAGIRRRILTLHNSVKMRSRFRRFFERRLLHCLDRVVAVSEAVKTDIVNKKNISAEKVTVIPNGVDVAQFHASDPAQARRALGLSGRGPVIGTVARLDRAKGADLSIRAAALLRPRWPELRVVLIGAGAEERRLRQLAEERGVSDMIFFAGHRDDARELVQAFDLVIQPSRKEGHPFSVLEAMASGKAVIASNVGGLPVTVVDGVTGLLFPSENVTALADAIGKLLDDPQARAKMGDAGRRRVEAQFSQAVLLERTTALYKDGAPRVASAVCF